MKKYLLAINTITTLLVGCNCEQNCGTTEKSTKGTNISYVGATALDQVPYLANLTREPVDASTLIINELYAVQMLVKGAIVGSLYVTTLGIADNVEIIACFDSHSTNMNGQQVPKTGCLPVRREILTRVTFAPFETGTITFKARACVMPERALTYGVLCGAWKETTWNQPLNSNAALTELLAKQQQIIGELGDMGQRAKAALLQYQKDADQCIARKQGAKNIPYLRNIATNLAQLADGVISKALEPTKTCDQNDTELDPDDSKFNMEGKVVDSDNKEIPGAKACPFKLSSLIPDKVNFNGLMDSASKNTSSMNMSAETPEVQAAARKISKAVSTSYGKANASAHGLLLVEQSTNENTLPGLQMLASAVVDIATASAKVDANRPCFAKSRVDNELGAINTRIYDLQKQLQEVDSKLLRLNNGNGG